MRTERQKEGGGGGEGVQLTTCGGVTLLHVWARLNGRQLCHESVAVVESGEAHVLDVVVAGRVGHVTRPVDDATECVSGQCGGDQIIHDLCAVS